jgi:bifunctional hydroxylase/dehydrase
MVSGLEVHYDVGPGEHPLLGMRMPNRELTGVPGVTHTYELLHRARGVLLDLADDPATRRLAADWSDRTDVITARFANLPAGDPLADARAVLVRPDGYIAWVNPGADDSLEDVLARWFGPARSRLGVG